MENKKISWKDVEIVIMGQKIDCKPIEYIPGSMTKEFEGSINITREELEPFINKGIELKKPKKLTNFQRKKEWKKFCKIFNIGL